MTREEKAEETDSMTTIFILAPLALQPTSQAIATQETPYGTVSHYSTQQNLHWLLPASPYAHIYVAKKMGATHIVDVLPLHAINRLLELHDIVLPTDLLDMTHGHYATFFVGKGYGFLPQNPPYCPILRTTLVNAARHIATSIPLQTRPRIFQRATYAALEKGTSLDTITQHIPSAIDIDVIGVDGVPTSFLARELELCYAPLGYIARTGPHASAIEQVTLESHMHSMLHDILLYASHIISPERTCVCTHAMQAVRQRGLIDDDWTTWIAHM